MKSKTDFLNAYAAGLREHHNWAKDPLHLARYMHEAEQSIRENKGRWKAGETPAICQAWKAIGLKGKPSLATLRKLPD